MPPNVTPERFAEGITSCRVTLTQEQASHAKGNKYSVMVEVRLPPNHDLAVRKMKDIRDMPAQLPGPGMALRSISSIWRWVILPLVNAPRASKTEMMSRCPGPGRIVPP